MFGWYWLFLPNLDNRTIHILDNFLSGNRMCIISWRKFPVLSTDSTYPTHNGEQTSQARSPVYFFIESVTSIEFSKNAINQTLKDPIRRIFHNLLYGEKYCKLKCWKIKLPISLQVLWAFTTFGIKAYIFLCQK